MSKINVISVNNGVGLSRDYEILRANYPDAEYNFIDIYKGGALKQADINIYLEIVEPKHFALAKVNILIPNPEWFNAQWVRHLSRFDAIFCKTKDAFGIFSKLHKNVIFTGFASLDRYLPEITTRKMIFLHVAGKSETKGTPEVIKAFEDKGLPLIVVSSRKWRSTAKNIRMVGRMADDELQKLQNECLFHVCTSQYEGFGHYLHEARSCSIVLTTDAPPMNEWNGMVKINVSRYGQQNYGKLAYIDYKHLASIARALTATEPDKLKVIFTEGRRAYLSDCIEFKQRITAELNRYTK